MLYKDIDKETARQCCRKHKESDCEHCPLRRDFKDLNGKVHKGICWFILMRGLEYATNSPYTQAEKAILEQEHVSYPHEWLEWLKSHKETKDLSMSQK
jgi:hypothetical protein